MMYTVLILLTMVAEPFQDFPLRTATPFQIPEDINLSFLPVSLTDSFLQLVSQDTVTFYDTRLQNFQTRYSFADSNVAASQWLYDKFQYFVFDSIAFDSFPHPDNPSSWQRNVVAVKNGDMEPDKVLVIGGHFDSVVYGSGTDPYVWAPGADDNGSGTTGTLEIARVLKNFSPDKTLYFVPFAAEEQGLYGSDHFAEEAYNRGMNIVLMSNMDMIGYEPNSEWNVTVESNSSSSIYVDLMGEMALLYTDSLVPELYYSTGAYSDHWPFLIRGYKAVFASEGDFNYNGWHTNYDIIDSLNMPYMTQVIQMVLATVLQVSEMPDPPDSLSALNVGDGQSVFVSWVPPVQTDVKGYRVYYREQSQPPYQDTVYVSQTDTTLSGFQTGIRVYFAVSSVDTYGYESFLSPEVSVVPTIGVAEAEKYPEPVLLIKSSIARKVQFTILLTREQNLSISLYDAGGRIVRRIRKEFNRGEHSFDFEPQKSGVYFLDVQSPEIKETRKLLIMP